MLGNFGTVENPDVDGPEIGVNVEWEPLGEFTVYTLLGADGNSMVYVRLSVTYKSPAEKLTTDESA
jgi:hypothetical protein